MRTMGVMLGEKYAELAHLFNDAMKKDMPAATLAKLGEQIKTYGALEKTGDVQVTKSGPNTIAVFPVKFAKQSIDFRLIVNGQGMIAGMFLQPGAVDWKRPAYSQPDSFKERAVTVGEGDWKLPGTLTMPNGAGPFPAVVLVHGSGPNDRD